MNFSLSVIIGLDVATSNSALSMVTLRISVFSSSVSVTVRFTRLMPATVNPLPSMLRMLSSMVGYGMSFSMHDAASRSAAAEKSMRRYFIVYCFFLSHKCIVIPKLMAAILSRKRMFEALREPILLP